MVKPQPRSSLVEKLWRVTERDWVIDYVAFTYGHLDSVLRLCEAEGWLSFPMDAARAGRALTKPGVITVVAIENGEVLGFAQMLSDGEIQAFLSLVVVAAEARGRGVGKTLVEEASARSGAQRVDLLSLDKSQHFYCSFAHRMFSVYRIYPGHAATNPL